jgi:hypothetical protein
VLEIPRNKDDILDWAKEMLYVEGNMMIFSWALDWAESSSPFGSAARMQIEGFMTFAARATPEIKLPPIVQSKKYLYKFKNEIISFRSQRSSCSTYH